MTRIFLYLLLLVIFVFIPGFFFDEVFIHLKRKLGIHDFEVITYFGLFYLLHFSILFFYIKASTVKRIIISILNLLITEVFYIVIVIGFYWLGLNKAIAKSLNLKEMIIFVFTLREVLYVFVCELTLYFIKNRLLEDIKSHRADLSQDHS